MCVCVCVCVCVYVYVYEFVCTTVCIHLTAHTPHLHDCLFILSISCVGVIKFTYHTNMCNVLTYCM